MRNREAGRGNTARANGGIEGIRRGDAEWRKGGDRAQVDSLARLRMKNDDADETERDGRRRGRGCRLLHDGASAALRGRCVWVFVLVQGTPDGRNLHRHDKRSEESTRSREARSSAKN